MWKCCSREVTGGDFKCVAFSSTTSLVAVGGLGHTVAVIDYDVKHLRLVHVFSGEIGNVSLQFAEPLV